MAAIANYHKLGGLKQRKCIVLQFWTPEVLKSRHHRAPFLLDAPGDDLFSCFLSMSRDCLHFVGYGPSFTFQAREVASSKLSL